MTNKFKARAKTAVEFNEHEVAMSSAVVGIVIIGRNEGDRLTRCLQSLPIEGLTVVYVDSGSTDGSQDNAKSFGASVVALDLSKPFKLHGLEILAL